MDGGIGGGVESVILEENNDFRQIFRRRTTKYRTKKKKKSTGSGRKKGFAVKITVFVDMIVEAPRAAAIHHTKVAAAAAVDASATCLFH